eukprot:7282505-Karenia_brevis.AAC.1
MDSASVQPAMISIAGSLVGSLQIRTMCSAFWQPGTCVYSSVDGSTLALARCRSTRVQLHGQARWACGRHHM